jgi:hypothetical protein
MIKKYLFSKKINITCILKNITGSKNYELLGSYINEFDLNLLLSESFRIFHNKLIIDIITHGEKSKFWNLFINGKMSRDIDIINPINKMTYNVKISINIKSRNKNIFIFDVIMTDITKINTISNKTSLIAHDLKSLFRIAQNITYEIEKKWFFNL